MSFRILFIDVIARYVQCMRPASAIAFIASLIVCLPADANNPGASEVLVNGNFEVWEAEQPAGWTISIGAMEGQGPESTFQPGEDVGTGNHALRLSGNSDTQRWYAATQVIDSEPGEIFRFSGWMRTENVIREGHKYSNCQIAVAAKAESGQRINVWILGPAIGTTDWKRYTAYLQTPLGSATLEVSVFLSMSGAAHFDDISLLRLPAPDVDPEAGRDERWRADLHYLAEFLPKLHVKPFTMTSEEDFRSQVGELEAAIGDLSDMQINLQLMALVASLGDAHTSIGFSQQPRSIPIQFGFFGDELRVVAVDRRCSELAGGKVTRIGHANLNDVLACVRPLIACETESWFRRQAPEMLRLAEVLSGLDLSKTDGEVAVTVIRESGDTNRCAVKLPAPGEKLEFEICGPAEENQPLYLSNLANYWYRYIEESKTFYLQYNRCHQDPQRPIARFTSEVADALDAQRIERFVLDLRRNSGGSSTLLNEIIQAVAERRASGAIGRCYVITGRSTFSAAALNALDFRQATGALVVGEPMGNKPNRFGQLNVFALPYSGLNVQYATKHFVRVEGDPPILQPDIPAEITWSDYLAGRDPAMERILASE